MDRISAKQFFEQLAISNGISFTPYIITDEFIIDGKDGVEINVISLTEITFERDVTIRNLTIAKSILIKDCTFKASLKIENVTINANNGLDKNSVVIRNTTASLVAMTKVNVISKILITKAQIKRLFFREVDVTGGSILLVNDTNIDDRLLMHNVFVKREISIGKSVVKRWEVDEVSAEGIALSDSIFKGDITLYNCKTEQISLYETNTFEEIFHIVNFKKLTMLSILGSVFKKGLLIANAKCIIGSIDIMGGSFDLPFVFQYNKQILNNLRIHSSHALTGTIECNSAKMHIIRIDGYNHNANFVFNDSIFNELTFTKFSNYSNITLSNIRSSGEGVLRLENANMGKMNLYNVDFSTFSHVRIEDTILKEISVSNIKWFTLDQLNKGVKEKDRMITNRETYRQLKHAMESQGERIKALEFKSAEMTEYSKILACQPLSEKNFGDKFILWTGKSNNHGLNFVKPAALLFTTSLLFYILISLSQYPNLTLNFLLYPCEFTSTLSYLGKNIEQVFLLTNPIHSIKDILSISSNADISSKAQILDFIQRLIAAYFVFQTISAFRKYVK